MASAIEETRQTTFGITSQGLLDLLTVAVQAHPDHQLAAKLADVAEALLTSPCVVEGNEFATPRQTLYLDALLTGLCEEPWNNG